ncbi:hypothetical protein GO308_12725 [Sphingomonas sp. SFZ2018-12]|uniref:hypothetical protein n=1 Tax=Sphingomonas sp. SFZ2018-12 TaxID=2683197 RepID=UPI001F0FC40E|nr:hypothetical protein [Sphingomonas sp. SFZ2018-12]MCH4893979.1 hypothetical protein [Sphingomonas sp. SFZ2018-12]
MDRPAHLIVLAAAVLSACGENPAIRQAKKAVTAAMRDPESARFTDVRMCGRSNVVTGKVNGRNAFGGYTGAQDFYFGEGGVAFQGSPDMAESQRWIRLSAMCTSADNQAADKAR